VKKPKSLFWKYFPLYILILVFSLTILTWIISREVKNTYINRIRTDLENRSLLIARIIQNNVISEQYDTVQSVCQDIGKEIGFRITVILPSGRVITDSEHEPAAMENHADRSEIIQAMNNHFGTSIRYSKTLKKEMIYTAVPLLYQGKIAAVVRSSLSIAKLYTTINAFYRRMAIIGFLVVCLAIGISFLFSRRIKRIIQSLKEAAVNFGEGKLDYRVHISGSEEFEILSVAMNNMASDLNFRINKISEQHKEMESIISCMSEGLLVINLEERVVRINKTAANIFEITPDQAEGKDIHSVIRQADFLRFISENISDKITGEREVILHGARNRYLQAKAAPMLDHEDNTTGIVIVINDITRLKQLEEIRKDFVANVSHELKTPLTSIVGSIETLKESGMEDRTRVTNFINMIQKNSHRLASIVEDLLKLSRLEQDSEIREIKFEKYSVKYIIDDTVALLRKKVEGKNITVKVNCSDAVSAEINRDILEDGLINLVDNAIKYSPEASTVTIECRGKEDWLELKVTDQGSGIAAKHIPRIFERFYRVDKSRSRKLGGTGLGLSIVKHAVEAHKGSVNVNSKVGKGTSFIIYIPLKQTAHQQKRQKKKYKR